VFALVQQLAILTAGNSYLPDWFAVVPGYGHPRLDPGSSQTHNASDAVCGVSGGRSQLGPDPRGVVRCAVRVSNSGPADQQNAARLTADLRRRWADDHKSSPYLRS
jgi:hypothetical protein